MNSKIFYYSKFFSKNGQINFFLFDPFQWNTKVKNPRVVDKLSAVSPPLNLCYNKKKKKRRSVTDDGLPQENDCKRLVTSQGSIQLVPASMFDLSTLFRCRPI